MATKQISQLLYRSLNPLDTKESAQKYIFHSYFGRFLAFKKYLTPFVIELAECYF